MVNKKYNISYDEGSIVDERVKYILENKEEFDYIDNFEEDSLREEVYKDSDVFEWAWDDFKECMTEYLKEIDKNKNGVFKIAGKSLGWRNLDGYKTVEAETGQKLLSEILPQTDVSLYVWKTKTQIKIQCYHHDSPMGEFYYIKALNKQEYRDYAEENY